MAEARTPEVEGTEVDNGGMLATLSKAEIDVQIATAKRYPRSIETLTKQALAMATLDKDTARSMYYVLPRAGKTIEGGSIRFAEVIGSCWGNVVYAARVINEDDKFITAQGGCYDLEKNVKCTIEVRRRITDRGGRRYNDDMVGTTGNAATSIALRNAIFRVVPPAVFKGVLQQAKMVSLGKGTTMKEKADEAMTALRNIGAKDKDIFRVLKRAGVADLTIDDLIMMHGMVTAITQGDTTWDSILADVPKTDDEVREHMRTNLDDVADKVADGKKKEPSKAKEAEPTIGPKEADELRSTGLTMGLKRSTIERIVEEDFKLADLAMLPNSKTGEFVAKMEAAISGKE